MKKVLFFDIDGTLLNSELKIPEGVKRELKRLKEAGYYLFVASGRPLAFISNQIIEAGFNGFVLCNGAHVELNHEIIYENRIPYEKVNDLMNLLENVDCEYDFETATDCYIDPSYKDFIEFFKVCDIRHEKLIISFDKEEVMHRTLKIEISAKKDHDKIIEYIADKFYFDHHGTANSFEICALDTSKATGVEKVLEHLNIDKDHSYAFGDGLNDSAALTLSDIGVVMNESADISKQMSDILLLDNRLDFFQELDSLSSSLQTLIKKNIQDTVVVNSSLIGFGLFNWLSPSNLSILHNLTTLRIVLRSLSIKG